MLGILCFASMNMLHWVIYKHEGWIFFVTRYNANADNSKPHRKIRNFMQLVFLNEYYCSIARDHRQAHLNNAALLAPNIRVTGITRKANQLG